MSERDARERKAESPGRPRKWALLSLLVEAREAFGLKPRQLDVLRGLLTFLPGDWPERERAVVFPANRTLAERLNGMPESTLRRHLARLIAAGVIARRASPSGKRYRVGHAPDLVFGLDLAPFFAMAATLAEDAVALRTRRREIAEARMRLRLTLARRTGNDLALTLRLVRRRGATLAELRAALAAPGTDHPTGHAASGAATSRAALPPETGVAAANDGRPQDTDRNTDVPAGANRSSIETLEDWAGEKLLDLDALHAAGRRLSRGAGVTPDGWRHAQDAHGPTWASLAIGHLLRRGGAVRYPDRYFRELVRRATAGLFVIDLPVPD